VLPSLSGKASCPPRAGKLSRRKQYVPKKPPDDRVTEHIHDGILYKLGRLVHCRRQPDNRLCRGKINGIFTDDPTGEFFSFLDEATGQHRYAFFRSIIVKPTSANRASINASIVKNMKGIKKDK